MRTKQSLGLLTIAITTAGMGLAAVGILAAPSADAGCQYGGPGIINKCDGPIQPDGTWQRCVAFAQWMGGGANSYLVPDRRCDVMGPNQHPGDLAFAYPPTHIDD
jgi:hypothetical protein